MAGVAARAAAGSSRLRSFGGSWLFYAVRARSWSASSLVAVVAPLLAPYRPDATDLLNALAPPSPEHWLGTNQVGQDTLSRLIYGARTSLVGPLPSWCFSTRPRACCSGWSPAGAAAGSTPC